MDGYNVLDFAVHVVTVIERGGVGAKLDSKQLDPKSRIKQNWSRPVSGIAVKIVIIWVIRVNMLIVITKVIYTFNV